MLKKFTRFLLNIYFNRIQTKFSLITNNNIKSNKFFLQLFEKNIQNIKKYNFSKNIKMELNQKENNNTDKMEISPIEEENTNTFNKLKLILDENKITYTLMEVLFHINFFLCI